MLFCLQCSMRAMLEDKPPPLFDETAEEHLLKYHPDPAVTEQERRELETLLTIKMKGSPYAL